MSLGMLDIAALQPNWSAAIAWKDDDNETTNASHSSENFSFLFFVFVFVSICMNLGDSDVAVCRLAFLRTHMKRWLADTVWLRANNAFWLQHKHGKRFVQQVCTFFQPVSGVLAFSISIVDGKYSSVIMIPWLGQISGRKTKWTKMSRFDYCFVNAFINYLSSKSSKKQLHNATFIELKSQNLILHLKC